MAQMSLQQAVELGLAHHRAGRLRFAQDLYQQVLEFNPDQVDALHLLGIVEHQNGRSERSIELIAKALSIQPGVAVMHFNLAEALRAVGRKDEAAAELRRAVELEPRYVEAWNNLSMVQCGLGRYAEAADAARAAIELDPKQALPHNNLANALRATDQIEESIHAALQALELKPDFPEALNNLALGYVRQERVIEAMVAYRRAIKLRPDFAEAYSNLGAALARGGKNDEAIECFQRAIRIRPEYSEAYNNLAGALKQSGQLDQSVLCYEKAIALRPNFPEALTNLGLTLKDLGRRDEALQHIRRAIHLKPDFAEAYYHLGATMKERMELDDAAAAYERAMQLEADHVGAKSALGIVRMEQGRLDEAMQLMRDSLKQHRDWQLHSNLCLLTNYHSGLSGEEVLEEHRRWEAEYATPRADAEIHANDRSPDRKLRIGYVSPDFRSHAVSHFTEPVLSSHDRERYEIFAYAHVAKPDAMTHMFAKHADVWREIFAKTDHEIEKLIREDKIDILVDLAGHTAHNRLTLFSRKPAPVQVSMIGYPCTTGMSAMDYKISDHVADPPGAERFYSEKLVRLDGTFWCFRPLDDLEGVTELPAKSSGRVTFGSVNNFAKITPIVLDLWARIVAAVPNSRIIMQSAALGSASTRARALEAFARRGVEDRVTCTGWTNLVDYFDLIRSFDIALDTFPFNGGTTSCQLLFYGAPFIALAGERQVSRMGASMLTAIGLTELVASSTEDYFNRTVALAGDIERLAGIRANLRTAMLRSPLCDAVGYTRKLEASYRAMWRTWCESASGASQ